MYFKTSRRVLNITFGTSGSAIFAGGSSLSAPSGGNFLFKLDSGIYWFKYKQRVKWGKSNYWTSGGNVIKDSVIIKTSRITWDFPAGVTPRLLGTVSSCFALGDFTGSSLFFFTGQAVYVSDVVVCRVFVPSDWLASLESVSCGLLCFSSIWSSRS